MLAEMNTLCKFSKYGCAEVVKYIEKRRHEETCPRAPSGCPVDACGYVGLDLRAHLQDDHGDTVAAAPFVRAATVTLRKGDPFRVLVQEQRDDQDDASVFLLLNGGGVLAGRSLSLARLGPGPEGNGETSYKMEVRGCQQGALSLAATAPRIRLLEGFEAKRFLFVPDADWGPSGSVSVSIRVG